MPGLPVLRSGDVDHATLTLRMWAKRTSTIAV